MVSKDFTMPTQEEPCEHEMAHTKQLAHDEAETTPFKRIKSDIAAWMTQMQKQAIRRSLGTAIASRTPR